VVITLAFAAAELKDGLRAESRESSDGGPYIGKTSDDCGHPSEGVDNHQVNEASTQDVLEHPTEKVRWIELAFGRVLDPGDDNLDEE
jgi:hypothetical protein